MKKIIFIIGFALVSLSAMTQEKKAVWDYPVKPESKEWQITSYVEKIKKSQPPKEILNGWTTETLFKYCIEYPFNKVTLMFNNPNDGFKRVYEQSSLSAILKIMESDGESMSKKDGISMKTFRDKTNNEYFVDDDMDSAIINKAINFLNR
jgi:hypothetical protein